ncbi:MAG: TonB-dependent receptor [Opitutaceae bacterium]|nr:TonB-dependent receptor [Opitutaceae bacterium]
MRLIPSSLPILTAVCATMLHASDEPPTLLPTYVVSVARSPQAIETLPIEVRIIGGDALAAAPTIDTALRDDPGFSLFRRNSSFSANPTAQGVSIRGVGPSGASRTAVLLDGLPLNDPFGGWITWGAVPALSLEGAEIAHGGGSGTWGNAALGGTVALASAPLATTAGTLDVQAGSDGLWRADLAHTQALASGAVRLDARAEGLSGFHPVPPEDRGDVDRPLDHRHRLAQVAWSHRLATDTEARLTARLFEEDRGNGTELQENHTELGHLALALEGREAAQPLWQAAAWMQRSDYSSFFTAVSADRMQETPANDQFSVPATAAGAQASRIFRHTGATTVAGADLRWVEGETREDYFYRDGAFTQRRQAGGVQHTLGAFLHHDRALGERWHLTGALRIDHWAGRDGHTQETTLATGAITRDDIHPDRDGVEFSPRLGVSAMLARDTRVRAAAYRAFRQPTLNEYFRPFRVGSTSTLANADLDPETLDGVDLGLEQALGAARLSLGAFWNRLEDGVGNITLTSGPAGTTRQRQNIEEIRVRGLEVALRWSPLEALTLRAAGLAVDAEVAAARAQPGLVGKRLAQVPDYVVTFAADWQATTDTRVGASLRACGRQFEDDENRLVLAAAATVDVRIDHRISPGAAGFLELQNILDRPAQTSRSPAGLVTYDQPRALRGGVRFIW